MFTSLLEAAAAVATIITLFLAVMDRRRKVTSLPSASDEALTTRHPSGVEISRTRVIGIIILMLISAGFGIAGFFSSIHQEEPLKASLRSENLQATVRGWLDSFGIATQPIDDPDAIFAMRVTLANDLHAEILQPKKLDRYIVLRSAVTLGPEDRAMYDKLSQTDKDKVGLALQIEMARAKIGFQLDLMTPNLPVQLILERRIPITNDLTEAVLMQNIDDMNSAKILAMQTLTRSFRYDVNNKP